MNFIDWIQGLAILIRKWFDNCDRKCERTLESHLPSCWRQDILRYWRIDFPVLTWHRCVNLNRNRKSHNKVVHFWSKRLCRHPVIIPRIFHFHFFLNVYQRQIPVNGAIVIPYCLVDTLTHTQNALCTRIPAVNRRHQLENKLKWIFYYYFHSWDNIQPTGSIQIFLTAQWAAPRPQWRNLLKQIYVLKQTSGHIQSGELKPMKRGQ